MTFDDLVRGGPRLTAGIVFGGGGSGSTTSTNYTSSLPEYAEPYYTELMARAEAVAQEPYQTYQQPRVADFSDDQYSAMQGTRSLYQYGSPAMDAAMGWTDYGLQATGAAMQNPNLHSTYGGAGDYGAWLQSQYGGAPTYNPMHVQGGQFNEQMRDYYMSPYMDAVTERLQASAVRDAQEAQKYRDAEATAAGAFGGSRRHVRDAIAERGLMSQLSDIEAEQTQQAFENAQMQFERDRQRALQAAGQTEASRQFGAGLTEQGRQFGAGLGADLASQRAGLYEQGRQYGSGLDAQLGMWNQQYDLDAANTMFGGAEMMGALGDTSQGMELERINALFQQGQIGQDQYQKMLDTAYEDFINQRDYPRNALTWLSGIMHGVPVTAEQNVVQYQPKSSLAGALGSGIAGLSLYKSLTGSGST